MNFSKRNIAFMLIIISVISILGVSCVGDDIVIPTPPISEDLPTVIPIWSTCPALGFTEDTLPILSATPSGTLPLTFDLPEGFVPDEHTDGFEMDATLAAGIRESENLPEDAILTKEYLKDITSLYIWEQKIRTLIGIEYLPNLEIFSTDTNDLRSVKEIESLANLKQFRIGSGYVAELPDFARMSSLQEFSITGNLICDISPISNANSLTFLNLSVNRITSIAPLSELHTLTALILDGNCITDYSSVSQNKEIISALEFSGHRYKDMLALEAKAKEIVSDFIRSDMSELEKEYTLYRYIIDHARYSEQMRKNMPFGYYIINEGVGVCGDYAEAFALLSRHAGLDVICVSSDTHMWNMIFLSGKYYHVDTLWDEGNDTDSPIYFNRSTQFVQSLPDHTHDMNKYPPAYDMPISEYSYLLANQSR